MSAKDLQVLPNVGPAVAGMLMRAGVEHPDDLAGWTAGQLYRRVCEVDERRRDPCLLDTFVAVMDYVGGASPRPWWYYSRLRIGTIQASAS